METIPTLDVRAFRGPDRAGFVAALGAAFTHFGFVALRGHDVTPALSAPAYDALRRFFALPEASKLRYHVPGGAARAATRPSASRRRRISSDPDLKEFWHVGPRASAGHPLHGLPPNLWPAEVPEFRPRSSRCGARSTRLGAELLSAIALFLGLPADWFADKIDHGNSILRPLHYPPVTGVCTACARRRTRTST